MENENERRIFSRRIEELSSRAETRGTVEYTEFMDADARKLLADSGLICELSGGYDGAERVTARFGDGDSWNFTFVEIAPKSEKFAEELTHRDFLGSLMALGIRREATGDILVAGKTAYLVCLKTVAPLVCGELREVRKTAVVCRVMTSLPVIALPQPERLSVVVASERLDALIAAAFDLSRSDAKNLLESGRVSANSRTETRSDLNVNDGAVISARGYGRFAYRGIERETKKGKNRVIIELYR